MSIDRRENWDIFAKKSHHLVAFLKLDETLENILGDFATSADRDYRINTSSGSMNVTSRSLVQDAADSLGGRLIDLSSWYSSQVRESGNHLITAENPIRVGLFTYDMSFNPTIDCTLHLSGKDENQVNGLFESIRNRMGAEIQRQFPIGEATLQTLLQPIASGPRPIETQPTVSGSKPAWRRFWQHPTVSQVVAILVGTGLLALIGILWNKFG